MKTQKKKTTAKKRLQKIKATKSPAGNFSAIKKFPILTFFVGATFIFLVVLGSWQVKRLLWKNELVSIVEKNITQPTTNIPSKETGLAGYEFRKVRVTGSFLNYNEIHLAARYHKNKLGYHVLTPFRLDDGRVLLINRGWIPATKKDVNSRPETIISERTTINALVLKQQRKGWFIPENDIKKNLWFWVDFNEAERVLKLKLQPFILQEIGFAKDEKLPIAVVPNPEIRNDHLQYAITWYSLSIALLVIYFIYIRKPE